MGQYDIKKNIVDNCFIFKFDNLFLWQNFVCVVHNVETKYI